MGAKRARKPVNKHVAAVTPVARTLTQARHGLREFALTAAGCAAILAVLMLLHMRPFG